MAAVSLFLYEDDNNRLIHMLHVGYRTEEMIANCVRQISV